MQKRPWFSFGDDSTRDDLFTVIYKTIENKTSFKPKIYWIKAY